MGIILILVLGLVLRLVNLNQSLWLDEAVQAITSRGSLAAIFSELHGDFHPPLYHLLLWFWVHLFGSNEIALRFPSVLFGVGTVWVIYKIASLFTSQESKSLLRHLRGVSLARLAALFLATAPFHIYYSQEARPYALAALLASLSMYWFIKKVKMGYILATTLMLYSSYYGFLVLLAQIIAALIFLRKRIVSLFHCFLVPLIFFLPVLPLLFVQLKTGFQATHDLPNWSNLTNVNFFKALPLTFVKFSLGRITIFDKRLYALAALGLFGFLGILGGRGGIRWYRRYRGNKRYETFCLPVFLWLAVPVILSWLTSLAIPNYQPFRLLLVLPAFYLLLAMGIMVIKNEKLKTLALSFILLTSCFGLLTYFGNSYFHREDWRGLVSYLKNQERALVVLPSETSSWPIKYYDPEGRIRLVTVGKEVREIREIRETGEIKGEEVFYIRYLVPVFDPKELIIQKLTGSGYVKIKEISFNQIPVWEYTASR